MDRLHEELKQPVCEVSVNTDRNADRKEDTDSERSSIVDDPGLVHRGRVPSPVFCDATEISDTDYETCDSGLSTENCPDTQCSVSADMSTTETRDQYDYNIALTAASSAVTSKCTFELVQSDDVCKENGTPESCSLSDLSENAVGDVANDNWDNVKNNCAKFETGAGEQGVTESESSSCTVIGFSNGVHKNGSVPSIDSAISDIGSGFSVLTDSEACQGEDCSSIYLLQSDSARSTQSSLTSRKSSPRLKDTSDSDRTARVRRTSEGTSLATTV